MLGAGIAGALSFCSTTTGAAPLIELTGIAGSLEMIAGSPSVPPSNQTTFEMCPCVSKFDPFILAASLPWLEP